MRRTVGLLFMLFAMVFLCIGGYMAHRQRSRLLTNQPVPAEVISSTIESRTDSDGDTTYTPKINFRYFVAGRPYTSDDALVLSMGSSHGWAQDIVSRYPAGAKTSAYVNPDDPLDVFLVPDASFLPYIFILFPMVFVAVGLALTMQSAKHHAPGKLPSPTATADGWSALRSEHTIAGKARQWGVVALVVAGVGAGAATHFASVAESYGLFFLIAMGVYALFAAGLLAAAVYYVRLKQLVGDATLYVEVDPYQLTSGQTMAVFVEQPVRTGLEINRMSVGLIREVTSKVRRGSKTSYSTQVAYEDEEDVVGAEVLRGDQPMQYGRTITVPDHAPGTDTSSGYPKTRWFIQVHTDIPNAPDYRARFPVIVG